MRGQTAVLAATLAMAAQRPGGAGLVCGGSRAFIPVRTRQSRRSSLPSRRPVSISSFVLLPAIEIQDKPQFDLQAGQPPNL
jgi:hypothetical protein